MGKVLIIGAGGVATVAAHKVAQNADVFTEIMIASRTKSKCDAIVEAIGNKAIKTAQVDADDVEQLVALFESFRPDIVMNLALPYQDLTIMEACLRTGVNYLDTANYEPKDEAHFEYSWQWAYKDRFEKAGLTAILGCGFDPGVTSVYTAYAAKHYFDEIHYLDIVDCNAGDHHKAFATNFNPEINIREITQKELSDYQACPFLDDFRTGISDPFAGDTEYRHGQYQAYQLQRYGNRSVAVPQSRVAQSARPR